MDKILPALAVAVVSGLGWLAYKHPAGYRRLGAVLFPLNLFVFIAIAIWDLASDVTTNVIIHHLPASVSAAEVFQVGLSTTVPLWVSAGLGASLGWLYFLFQLPRLLRDDDAPTAIAPPTRSTDERI